MKKIVFLVMMLMGVGSLTTLQAATDESAQVIRGRSMVEQITNRMTAQLVLTELQAKAVLELNHAYYFLFEGDAPKAFTDKKYRKSWNSYDRKLRRILTTHQYTLYLAQRGTLYAVAPRPSIPRAYVQSPVRVPRVTVPQGQGNTRRPMAATPRNGNRGQGVNPQRENRGQNVNPQRENRGQNVNPQRENRRPEVGRQRQEQGKPEVKPQEKEPQVQGPQGKPETDNTKKGEL